MIEDTPRTLTLSVIASEAAERSLARADLCRVDEDLDVSEADFAELCANIAWGRPRTASAWLDGTLTFQGPSGAINIRPDATIPPGTWKWRDKNPFARWFPEATP